MNMNHSLICESCNSLNITTNNMRRKIEDHQDILFSEEKREDLLHDFGQALESIWKWKAHILRSVNQEKAKQQVLDNLDNSSVLIVADWAMKFQAEAIPRKTVRLVWQTRNELAHQ